MLYDTRLFQKDKHFQLKIKIRKVRYVRRRRESVTETGRQREERLKRERRKPGKEKVWYILCKYFTVLNLSAVQ